MPLILYKKQVLFVAIFYWTNYIVRSILYSIHCSFVEFIVYFKKALGTFGNVQKERIQYSK